MLKLLSSRQNGVISCKNRVLKIVAIYHPPYSARNLVTDDNFIDKLTDWLTDTLASDKHILAMGDFNIHINKDNNENSKHLPQLHDGNGITSAATPSLQIKKEIAWTLFLLNPSGISWSQPADQLPTSPDHQIVAGNISIPKDDVTRKEIMYRKLKLINYTDLAEEMHLDLLLLENLEYNDLVRKFEGNMKEALNIIGPEIIKTITVRHQNPWFTEELRTQKKIVRRMETIYKKYGQNHQWLALRGERTKYKQMIWNSWKEKLSNGVLDARGNTKQLYNLVSNLTNNQQLNPLTEDTPSEELVDRFVDYLIEKIRTIQDSLANYPTYCPTSTPYRQFSNAEFKPYIWKRK